MAEAAQRCQGCSDLDLVDVDLQDTSVDALRNGSTSGCASCNMILRALLPRHEEALIRSEGKLQFSDESYPYFRFRLLWGDTWETEGIEFFKMPGTHTSWSNIRSANFVSGDTSSTTTLQQALTWFSECLSSHRTCNSRLSTGLPLPHLPKRVIDVTPLDVAGSVRLVEPVNEQALYLCLSHCWGTSSRPLTLVKENLSQFKSGISLLSLPKTFQDAIDFVRRLGFQYLWIDSLCILQDSFDDWEQQSIKMAEIYQNSHLTLAAIAARDSSGGLYQADAGLRATPIEVKSADEDSYTIYYRKSIPHWYNIRSPNEKWSFYPMEWKFPLLHRGWVFQERLMSPRILYFGPAELTWECCERFTCECVDGVVEDPQNHPKSRHSKALLDEKSDSRREIWCNIVEEFSTLHLTHPEDCFPALQGIASQLLRDMSNKIISGLWGNSQIWNLLWRAANAKLSRTRQWRAPSWSWACLDGSVNFWTIPTTRTTEYASIEGFDIPDQDKDDRAILLATSLTLSAQILPGMITYNGTNSMNGPFAGPFSGFRFVPSGADAHQLDDPYSMIAFVDWDYSAHGAYHIESGASVYYVRMLTSHTPSGELDWGLLIRTIGEANQQFERIGVLQTIFYNGATAAFYNRKHLPNSLTNQVRRAFEGIERTTITLL